MRNKNFVTVTLLAAQLTVFLSACGGQPSSSGSMEKNSNPPGSAVPSGSGTSSTTVSVNSTAPSTTAGTTATDPTYTADFDLLGNDSKFTLEQVYTDTVLKVSLRGLAAGTIPSYGNAALHSPCLGFSVSIWTNGTQIGATRKVYVNTQSEDGTGACDKTAGVTANPTVDFSSSLNSGRTTPISIQISNAYSNTCGPGYYGSGAYCVYTGSATYQTGCPYGYAVNGCWKPLYRTHQISGTAMIWVNTVK